MQRVDDRNLVVTGIMELMKETPFTLNIQYKEK